MLQCYDVQMFKNFYQGSCWGTNEKVKEFKEYSRNWQEFYVLHQRYRAFSPDVMTAMFVYPQQKYLDFFFCFFFNMAAIVFCVSWNCVKMLYDVKCIFYETLWFKNIIWIIIKRNFLYYKIILKRY